MSLLAAARDLPQAAIPATNSRFGRPPNTLMIYCSEIYARTITLVHQNSRKCIQIISETSPVRCIQHSLQKNLNTPSRHAASKPLLTPHMRNRCLQFTWRYLHGSVDDWKKVMSSDESTFQCMSSNE